MAAPSAAASPSAGAAKHCFVCFEEETAVRLLPCGCMCVNMLACAPCLLRVMKDSLSSNDWASITCTVCRGKFSAESALAACDGAGFAVAELPWTAPERYDVELMILDVMVETSLEAGFQRTKHVMQQCLQFLGSEHDASVNCAFRLTNALMQKDEFQTALAVAMEWEETLCRRAKSLNEQENIHATANALFQMFQFKSQKASCLAQFASEHLRSRAETEFMKAISGLYEASNTSNDAFIKTLNLFGVFMTNRTQQHFEEQRRLTRQSKQLWLKAMLAVHKAVQIFVAEFGPDGALTDKMQQNLLVLQQIGRDASYELEDALLYAFGFLAPGV